MTITYLRPVAPSPGRWTIVEKAGNGKALRVAWNCPHCLTIYWEIVGEVGVGKKLSTSQRKRVHCPNCDKLRKAACEFHKCCYRGYYGLMNGHNCGLPYPNKDLLLPFEPLKEV